MKQNLITLILFGIIVILLGVIVFLLVNYNTDNTNYNQINTQVELPNEVVNNSVIANLPEGIIEIDYQNVTNENKVPTNQNYVKPGITVIEPGITEDDYNFDINKVNIMIKPNSITNTSMDIILSNNNKKGAPVYIEVKGIEKYNNGRWDSITNKKENVAYTGSVGAPANGITEARIDWKNHFGYLESGKYRIEFLVKDKATIYVEFNIN